MTYIARFEEQTLEIEADSVWDARQIAAKAFGIPPDWNWARIIHPTPGEAQP